MSHTMRWESTQLTIVPSTVRSDEGRSDQELSRMMRLPDEVKLEIIAHIDRKRDLYNLSLACRKFEDIVMRRLYEKIDVEVPELRFAGASGFASKVPMFRPVTLGQVKELKIRPGVMDVKDPVYSRRRKIETCTVDQYACDLLRQIQKNQLHSFQFLHQTPLSLKVVETLADHQHGALQHLHFFEAEDHLEHLHMFESRVNAKITIPQHLRTIRCHSVRSGGAVGMLIQANKLTLESLHLGQEKELADLYRRGRIGFLDQISQPRESFRSRVDLSALPRLRELTLVGLNLSLFIPRDVNAALYLCNLDLLAIESCAGAAEFLNVLASTFQFAQNSDSLSQRSCSRPQLKSFSFRHEAFNNALKDALIGFLGSFHGLERLSLLFENATLVDRPSTMISNHGSSLKILVLECRIQPREHLGLDTSRPLGTGGCINQLWQESINDICETCPNLIELGMGFPWDDEMIRLKKTKLLQLQHLRTIHLRNFPQSQVLSQLGDYAIQEHARRFVEWCFPSRVGGAKPRLETLAIGPTLYESRWKYGLSTTSLTQSSNNYRRHWNPPEYLRTHHICVDWAKTRFGRWHSMITPVSERYMEELRTESPLGGVFEPVWLR